MISAIIPQICQIASGLASIKTRFEVPPPNISSGDLPALWVFADAASHSDEPLGEEYDSVDRIFRAQVAVMTLSEGNPYARDTKVRPILESYIQMFRRVPSLRNLPFVQSHKIVRDSSIVILPEYGAQFIGFEVQHRVLYYEKIEFESGE